MQYNALGSPFDPLNELMDSLARGEVSDAWHRTHAPDGDLTQAWNNCELYGAMVTLLRCIDWLTPERLASVIHTVAADARWEQALQPALVAARMDSSTFSVLEALDDGLFRLSFGEQSAFHRAICDAIRSVAPPPPRLEHLGAIARRHRAARAGR